MLANQAAQKQGGGPPPGPPGAPPQGGAPSQGGPPAASVPPIPPANLPLAAGNPPIGVTSTMDTSHSEAERAAQIADQMSQQR
jgi:hypothetical protein